MIELRFPAFRGGVEVMTLAEAIEMIDGSAWRWRLLNFDGTSKPKSGLDVLGLDDCLDRSSQGMDYSWPALIDFVKSVHQAFDATLVALDAAGKCVLVLEVLDSTYWRILADEVVPEAVASLADISRLQQGGFGE